MGADSLVTGARGPGEGAANRKEMEFETGLAHFVSCGSMDP